MIKTHKFLIISLILFIGLTGTSWEKNYDSIQAAWGEPSGLGTDLSEHPIGEDIKPWEGFRGWSPRVSYGQSPLGLNANPKSTPVYPNNDKNLSIKKDAKLERTESQRNSTPTNDDVKTWEGFRGWSPRVPYGN